MGLFSVRRVYGGTLAKKMMAKRFKELIGLENEKENTFERETRDFMNLFGENQSYGFILFYAR